MRRYRKLILVFVVTILIAIIPFLILGEAFEEEIKEWFQKEWSQAQRFWLIVGLLAVDIALPIPSSAVSTYGGSILGFFPAMFASWLGMMIGSVSGFYIARRAGPGIVRRLTKSEDLSSLEQLNHKLSLWTIVLTRPLPILAEATILLIGSLKLPVAKLILPLGISNLIIATAYSLVGAWAVERDVTLYVILASMFFPLLLTWIARRQLKSLFSTNSNAEEKA